MTRPKSSRGECPSGKDVIIIRVLVFLFPCVRSPQYWSSHQDLSEMQLFQGQPKSGLSKPDHKRPIYASAAAELENMQLGKRRVYG